MDVAAEKKPLTETEDPYYEVKKKLEFIAGNEEEERSVKSCHTPSDRSSDAESHGLQPDQEFAGDWEEERQTRETWTGRLDFILSCIGYAVGLGNIWRFPYLCYKNGGGAFMIPYFIFLFLCGLPLTVLEMNLGQFVSLGPTALFQKFCPMFEGLGWGQVIISGIVCVYYNMIIAWTLYYLFNSFRAVLPWSTCGNWWNSEYCVAGMGDLNRTMNATNTSLLSNGTKIEYKTASEEFWQKFVLQISDGIDNLDGIQWPLFIALAISWIVIFLCLCKGVKTSGKVVYVTATFPYVVLVILMIRGLTLPGAIDGVRYYLIPKWEKLLEINVWIAAASQIFYSVGAVWGVMFTFASFNRFHHDCYRDAMVIPLINCGTSVFAGIVVFSIIGFMAKEANMEVGDVITSGPGLAFIVYPEAVANFPLSPLWAILFFMMLLTIGVDSQFGMFETLITAFVDTWPQQLRNRKPAFTALVCFISFLLGIPCVTRGGMYVLQLMDWYCATFALMLIGALECLLVAWNYGWRRFCADIRLMVRRQPHPWWPIAWGFVTPVVVIALLIATFVVHTPVKYGDYDYPSWAIWFGWFLASISVMPIPFFALYNVLWKRRGMPFAERIIDAMRPTPDWGPSRLGDRVAYRKSLNQVPGRQLYVLGVERQETEMTTLAITRPSCAELGKFVEEIHIAGDTLDPPPPYQQ